MNLENPLTCSEPSTPSDPAWKKDVNYLASSLNPEYLRPTNTRYVLVWLGGCGISFFLGGGSFADSRDLGNFPKNGPAPHLFRGSFQSCRALSRFPKFNFLRRAPVFVCTNPHLQGPKIPQISHVLHSLTGREGRGCLPETLASRRAAGKAPRTHNVTPIHLSWSAVKRGRAIWNCETKQKERTPPSRGVWGMNPITPT